MKDKLNQAFYWIRKYKTIFISMLISAITIIIAINVFNYYSEAKIYNHVAKQTDELSQNIIRAYHTKPNYWGLSTEDVINRKIYPSGMKEANGQLLGFLKKPVEIGADDSGTAVMPTSKNFVIAHNELSKKQCVGFGGHAFNEKFWLKVEKITIKNEDISQDFMWGDREYGLPIDKEILKNICRSNNNSVVIHF